MNNNKVYCLNPCFNGRYSQSDIYEFVPFNGDVLILVLMEDTLRVEGDTDKALENYNVLILVLMEDTLRVRP